MYKKTKHLRLTIVNPFILLAIKNCSNIKHPLAYSNVNFGKNCIIYSSGEYTSKKFIGRSDFALDNRLQLGDALFTIDAFHKLGKDAIEGVGYYKNKIEQLLREEEKKTNEQKMFSKDVRGAILQRFPEWSKLKKDDLFTGFEEIFLSFGISAKVNLATVKKYYGVTLCKAKKEKGLVRLMCFRPDKEYD